MDDHVGLCSFENRYTSLEILEGSVLCDLKNISFKRDVLALKLPVVLSRFNSIKDVRKIHLYFPNV